MQSYLIKIEHIGSTSVPGLAAKDCIDVMVLVPSVADSGLAAALESAGYRCYPESWNRVEVTYGREYANLTFAPPIGARACNVHVRERNPAARYALLFRDYLRSDDRARVGWGAFKKRLAQSVDDLYDYGQLPAAGDGRLDDRGRAVGGGVQLGTVLHGEGWWRCSLSVV